MASFLTRLTGWMATSTSIIGTAVATPSLMGALTGKLSWAQAALPLVGSAIAILMPQATPAVTTNGTPTDGQGIPVVALPTTTVGGSAASSKLEQVANDVSQLAKTATSAVNKLAQASSPASSPASSSASSSAAPKPAWQQDIEAAAQYAPMAGAMFGGPVGAAVGAAVPDLVNFAETAYAEFMAAAGKLSAARAAVTNAASQLTASAHGAPASPASVPTVALSPAVPASPVSQPASVPSVSPASAPAPAPIPTPSPANSIVLSSAQLADMQAQMTANAQAAYTAQQQLVAMQSQMTKMMAEAEALRAAASASAKPPVTVTVTAPGATAEAPAMAASNAPQAVLNPYNSGPMPAGAATLPAQMPLPLG